jgi:AcrR family transcriptional regulator
MDKREKIINSANKLFLKSGYDRTSIDRIAKSAGISKGSVYTYFKSKEYILSEIVSKIADNLAVEIQTKFVKSTNVVSSSKAIIDIIVSYLKDNKAEYEILAYKNKLTSVAINEEYVSPFKVLDQTIFDSLASSIVTIEFAKVLRMTSIEIVGDFYLNGIEKTSIDLSTLLLPLSATEKAESKTVVIKYTNWEQIIKWLTYILGIVSIFGLDVLVINVYMFFSGKV